MIVLMGGVLDGHRPQRSVNSVLPMCRDMQQHCTSHVGDGYHSTLGHTILVMSIGSTIANLLVVVTNLIDKSSCFECTSVHQI